MSLPKVSSEVYRCDACGAVINPRWEACLACGEHPANRKAGSADVINLPSRGTTSPPMQQGDAMTYIQGMFAGRAAALQKQEGIGRIDAELRAYDEIKTCLVCQEKTEGETNAVRVAGGGWLHRVKCYGAFFGFRGRET